MNAASKARSLNWQPLRVARVPALPGEIEACELEDGQKSGRRTVSDLCPKWDKARPTTGTQGFQPLWGIDLLAELAPGRHVWTAVLGL
jgi:hypothetical protein